MLYKRIPLGREHVYLDAYIPDQVGQYISKALLVIPGGGYQNVCSEREGEPIALAFLKYGFSAFVLHYSVNSQGSFPTQLIEASLAMQHIRENSAAYNIDPDKIFAVGFSAGGHLAASLGSLWHLPEIYKKTGMPYGCNKPAGTMLIYPVITGVHPYAHAGSFQNLLETAEPTEEQLSMCSIELHVDARTAPAFIMHTANDQLVDVRNSILLANALAAAAVPFEMHVYPDGPHGVALGNGITGCDNPKWVNPAIAKWVENAAAWTDTILD